MGRAPYLWRKLTPKQREKLLEWRKRQGLPWHRPPHRASEKTRYHLTAACFQHRPYIGHSAAEAGTPSTGWAQYLPRKRIVVQYAPSSLDLASADAEVFRAGV